MNCIFCDNENNAKSVEHIVSESFGNEEYVLVKGAVCDDCNNKFSKFESTAMANSVFIMERARYGVQTKKGRTAKGKINDLKIEGHSDFKKQHLTIEGLNEEYFKNIDPLTGIGSLVVSSFDKSEVAASKLVLKTGLESIFTSQKTVYKKYDFSELKNYLTGKSNDDWPFLTSDIELQKFSSVPTYTDKYRLKQNHCELKFLELNESTLLFKFKFGAIPITLNLLNRNLDWIMVMLEQEDIDSLYPDHYKNKIGIA
jgi:hypothetical protein